MPFQYVLANLLSEIPTAVAVAFLDGEGETVSLITRQEPHDEVRIYGAYQGIFLNQLKAILKEHVTFFYYRTDAHASYTLTIQDEYYMVVITDDFEPLEIVRHLMIKAGKEIEENAL